MNEGNISYLCIGSNFPNAQLKLNEALDKIACLPKTRILAASPIFFTEPQDYKKQDWFYNQCVKVFVGKDISPEIFMINLLELESAMGRERKNRFGPRIIDLDILLFGDYQSSSHILKIPHPRMHKRAFVLTPLYILEPKLTLYGKNLTYWLSRLDWSLDNNKIKQA